MTMLLLDARYRTIALFLIAIVAGFVAGCQYPSGGSGTGGGGY